jgi:CubicO group peptidase (beta-lactamase class C family)
MRDSVPGLDLKDPELALPEGLFDAADLERYRRVLDRLAVPYRVEGRSKVVERTELPVQAINAAGGLVSTVRDLATLDRALDEFDLLQPATIAAAWTPAVDRIGDAMPTGLGWFVQWYRGERIVWHFGHVPNAYSALILKLPTRGLTLILLANSDGLSAPYLLQQGDVTRSKFAELFLKLAL